MARHVQIVEATTPEQYRDFVNLPYRVYKRDPMWRAPLRFERAEQINRKKNPGLERIDSAFWLALCGDQVVGRCASFVNHAHLDTYKDETGHFGFLDVELGEHNATLALIKRCEEWLRDRGMKWVAGPYNFSVNEEIGMLVDGFETPAVMMMPHGRKDYPIMLEDMGFEKAMDLIAYTNNLHEGYPRPKIVRRMIDLVRESKSLSVRRMHKDRFDDEIRLALDIFNDAWSDNWGFIPFGQAQVEHMASQLKTIIQPDGFWFGEVDGEAVAFVLMLPNLNEAVAGLNGKLLPFGWAKLLYRLKVKGVKTARIPLQGARKSIQKKRSGVALTITLFEECFRAMRDRGVMTTELSWILETNKDVQGLIDLSGAKPYKTYRIYRKAL